MPCSRRSCSSAAWTRSRRSATVLERVAAGGGGSVRRPSASGSPTRRRGGGCGGFGRRAALSSRCRSRRSRSSSAGEALTTGDGAEARRAGGDRPSPGRRRVSLPGWLSVRLLALRLGGQRRDAARHQHELALARRRQTSFHASCPLKASDRRGDGHGRRRAEAVALHRWAVIAEAANDRLTPAERGAVVRAIAEHAPHPPRRLASAATAGPRIDRWIRAWRPGGLEALRPSPRADTGAVRAHPELFDEAAALRLELPEPLGRPDRLDPLPPPRDPGRRAHAPGPAATPRASP